MYRRILIFPMSSNKKKMRLISVQVIKNTQPRGRSTNYWGCWPCTIKCFVKHWNSIIIKTAAKKKKKKKKTVENVYWLTVTYWPSTGPSVGGCTYVNKRKNSGSMWTLNNNITRRTDGLSQLGTRWRIESQWQTESFGPSMTHGWANKPRWERSAALVERRTLGQNNSLFPSKAYPSHTRNITLLRIKCEKYIFIKKCVRSFIEVRHYCWLFPPIFVYVLYICMWLYNIT